MCRAFQVVKEEAVRIPEKRASGNNRRWTGLGAQRGNRTQRRKTLGIIFSLVFVLRLGSMDVLRRAMT